MLVINKWTIPLDKANGDLPRQSNMSQQLSNQASNFDILPKSVWLGVADGTSIADLTQQLRYDIVVVLDLVGQQRRAKEVLQDINDSVNKLEQCERILVCTARTEKECVRVVYRRYYRGRRQIGEIGECRSWNRACLELGEQ